MGTNEAVLHGGEMAGIPATGEANAPARLLRRGECRAWLAIVLAVLGMVQSILITGVWLQPFGQYQMDTIAQRYEFPQSSVFVSDGADMAVYGRSAEVH